MNNISKEEKTIWDEYCKYCQELEKTKPYQNITERISHFLEPREEAIVLDAGCGIGGMFQKILKNINPKKIIAVDFNKKILAKAKERVSKFSSADKAKFEFQNINLLEPLSFTDESLDVIVSNSALCYIFEFKNKRGAESLKNLLTEMYRVLKPGGYLCWTAFSGQVDLEKVYSHYGQEVFENTPDAFIGGIKMRVKQEKKDFLTIEEIQKIHGEVGFDAFKTNYALAEQLVVMKAVK